MFIILQRAFFALCSVFLFGCASPACRQWEFQEILTKKTCFSGGRLILGSNSNFSRLELEIVRNRSGIRFYANLLFLEARPCQDDPTRACMEVLIEGKDPWLIYPYLL